MQDFLKKKNIPSVFIGGLLMLCGFIIVSGNDVSAQTTYPEPTVVWNFAGAATINSVHPLAMDQDASSLYIAGGYDGANGGACGHIEKRDKATGAITWQVNSGGPGWSDLTNCSGNATSMIFTNIELDPDGTAFYVAGYTYGSVAAVVQKRSTADGSVLKTWNFTSGANRTLVTVLRASSQGLYVGGLRNQTSSCSVPSYCADAFLYRIDSAGTLVNTYINKFSAGGGSTAGVIVKTDGAAADQGVYVLTNTNAGVSRLDKVSFDLATAGWTKTLATYDAANKYAPTSYPVGFFESDTTGLYVPFNDGTARRFEKLNFSGTQLWKSDFRGAPFGGTLYSYSKSTGGLMAVDASNGQNMCDKRKPDVVC